MNILIPFHELPRDEKWAYLSTSFDLTNIINRPELSANDYLRIHMVRENFINYILGQ